MDPLSTAFEEGGKGELGTDAVSVGLPVAEHVEAIVMFDEIDKALGRRFHGSSPFLPKSQEGIV